jgi:para-nitrobenzyl esterase
VQKALGASSLAEMRLASADKILALQKDCQLGCAGTIVVWPDIDGYFLPDSVPNIFAAGKQNDVATVSGFTRDESSNELRTAGNLEAYVAAVHKLYGDQAERFLTLYPASNDAEAKAMGLTAAREGLAEAGTRNWALAQHATGKAPFYMYTFSHVCIPSSRGSLSSTTRRQSARTTRRMFPTGSRRGTPSTNSGRHGTGRLSTAICRTG